MIFLIKKIFVFTSYINLKIIFIYKLRYQKFFMVLGNLNSVLENEQTIYEAVKKTAYIGYKKPTKLSNILASLSHYGMNYNDKVMKNMVAVPADNALRDSEDLLLNQTLYGTSSMNNWKIKPEEEKKFSEKTFQYKREFLRKMAMQPELEDILDIMADEAIVYDDNESYICTPYVDDALVEDLNEKSAEEIRNNIDKSFYKLYMLLDWKKTAWDAFKRYLIDGVLAYEIIYDNLEHPNAIIGIIDIDPNTITRERKNGTTYWVQFKGVIGQERKMLDTQVIYIKYEDTGVTTRQSYLERLLRPFNIYRIIEQAQVIWTVTQSSFKTKFTIPVGGMNKAKGQQTLAQAMNRYKEDISFNADTGELQVNGKTNMPFNKEYWMPENETGSPTIETLSDSGPQLNDSDQIKYFESKLWKSSKIPLSRFDKEAQATWFGTDPTQALRDEIIFSRFVIRLRNTFSEILLKPLRIQLSLSVPDLKNDKRILNSVSLRFNSYNLFEEMMNIEVMTKRIEFIGTIKDQISITDDEGNQEPYFSPKFLIVKYLKMSDADLELNEKYKIAEKIAKKRKGIGQNNEEPEDNDGFDMNNEEPEDNSQDNIDNEEPETNGPEGNEETQKESPEEQETNNDIDKEMLGDVQPESVESVEK